VKGVFFLKLQLRVEKLVVDFGKVILVLFDSLLMFYSSLIKESYLIENSGDLPLYCFQLFVGTYPQFFEGFSDISIVGVNKLKVFLKYLVVLIDSAVEKGEVVNEFIF
jgi:hypothetical protein